MRSPENSGEYMPPLFGEIKKIARTPAALGLAIAGTIISLPPFAGAAHNLSQGEIKKGIASLTVGTIEAGLSAGVFILRKR